MTGREPWLDSPVPDLVTAVQTAIWPKYGASFVAAEEALAELARRAEHDALGGQEGLGAGYIKTLAGRILYVGKRAGNSQEQAS